MPTKRFSFVVTIKLGTQSTESDLTRLIRINATSIRRYFDPSLLDQFIIIAPRRDLDLIEPYAKSQMPGFPFLFVDENALCPCFGYPDDGCDGVGWQGWHKQQILKIAAATIVRTPYYITLDDDVILTKPVTEDLLTREGRLIFSKWGRANALSSHESWYRSSCALLECPISILSCCDWVMSVTPEILVTEVVRQIQRELASIWNTDDYASFLLQAAGVKMPLTRNRLLNRLYRKVTGKRAVRKGIPPAAVEEYRYWTEYALYWVYLHKRQIFEDHYSVRGPDLTGNAIWTNDQSGGLNINDWLARSFELPHDYLFTVFTSHISNIDRTALYRGIESRLSANAGIASSDTKSE